MMRAPRALVRALRILVPAGLCLVLTPLPSEAAPSVTPTPGWMNFGGDVISDPAVVVTPTMNQAFAVEPPNNNRFPIAAWQLFDTTCCKGTLLLGGDVATAPTAAYDGTSTDVFVAGSDDAVWYNRFNGNAANQIWTSLGGGVISTPNAVAVGSKIYLFAVGKDHALWTGTLVGTVWSGWQPLGGVLTSDPFAIADPNGPGVYVFGRGGDGAMWSKRFTTSWSGWTSLGGRVSSFATAAPDASSLHVFALGTDNAIWEGKIPNGGSWSGWSSRGGGFLSAPSAAYVSGGDTYVVGVGFDNAIWYQRLTGSSWSNWTSLGGIILSNPTVVSAPTDVYVYGIGTNFALWQYAF